jgi:hypothetical protein
MSLINPELLSTDFHWYKGDLVRPFWSTLSDDGTLTIEFISGPKAGYWSQAKASELTQSPLERGLAS